MVKHIVISIVICVFIAFFYNYSVNYITGKLEMEWLKYGIVTNWDLRLIIILCVGGGSIGWGLSRLLKKLKKK